MSDGKHGWIKVSWHNFVNTLKGWISYILKEVIYIATLRIQFGEVHCAALLKAIKQVSKEEELFN